MVGSVWISIMTTAQEFHKETNRFFKQFLGTNHKSSSDYQIILFLILFYLLLKKFF